MAVFGSETDTETLLTAETLYASGRVRLYDDRHNGNGGAGVSIAPGTSAYSLFDDDGRNRWGDYSGGAYDWTCGHAWGAVQSATGAQSWKTTIAALEFERACRFVVNRQVVALIATVDEQLGVGRKRFDG